MLLNSDPLEAIFSEQIDLLTYIYVYVIMELIQITTHLNKAAFYVLQGGNVAGFEGKYWSNCKVKIEMTRDLLTKLNTTKDFSVKDYRKYMEQRAKIKLKIKKAYNVL